MSNFAAKTLALAALAVGWTGAAEAKACRLDGLELKAAPLSEPAGVKRKDLLSARFRVVRVKSESRAMANAPGEKAGSITAELKSGEERFFVSQIYAPHSAPWVSAISDLHDVQGSKSRWGKRDRAYEAMVFNDRDGGFDVYQGPLGGLALTPVACDPKG